MKNIVCILFFLSLFQGLTVFAQSPKDTIAKEKYQLSKKEFLQVYGTDDTARALINFYFNERSVKKDYYYFYAGVVIIEGILVGKSIKYNDELPYTESGIAFSTAAYTVIVFIPLTTYTLIKLSKTHKKFSKKKLYLDLINYTNGKGLSSAYKSNLIINSGD